MVIPTPFVDKVLMGAVDHLKTNQILCSCTKGILNEVGTMVSQGTSMDKYMI